MSEVPATLSSEHLKAALTKIADFLKEQEATIDWCHYWSILPSTKYDTYEVDTTDIVLGRLDEDAERLRELVKEGRPVSLNDAYSAAEILFAMTAAASAAMDKRQQYDQKEEAPEDSQS